ncbi:HAD family hydrolase [Nocardioides gansuensis]|uniref:D,D-heptose 1,7-bisphosphate phosphatase n=1 Tax=Nocardioides gansuensis TaxID=2138300 RepID=A0A2T8F9L9_9ACTN|nr:HAD-IIIA family hydrolase [Nocardioides gansuensis]PVG82431.1 HAD family hydrolase [Nocardioides gansuensis]
MTAGVLGHPEVLPTTVVVPTIGRPALRDLLDALARATGPRAERLVLVDDTPDGAVDERACRRPGLPEVVVLRSHGRGPAGARNLGWRMAQTEWVSFLDDDVVPDDDWWDRLAADLDKANADVVGGRPAAASQGRIVVPLPADRPLTDEERNTAGLASAQWITADMSYRRDVLVRVGGFDERFRRAYREDADLGLRVVERGGRILPGERTTRHPVPRSRWSASIARQRGNADDQLMRRLHGDDWRDRAGAPPGRLRRHLATSTAGALAVVLGLGGALRRDHRLRLLAAAASAGWVAGTAELAAARIAPGPRTVREVAAMVVTSVAIPSAAAAHAARGLVTHVRERPWPGAPDLVLFDRDGTLIRDVPRNTDPARVEPVAHAREALDRLRALGIPVGVATNQAAVGRGQISHEDCARINARVEELLGPFDTWQVCAHRPEDCCECRKPGPQLVVRACSELGVRPEQCVLIGDTAGDLGAAEAAGATGILVPNAATRPEEVLEAAHVASDLVTAVEIALRGWR